MARSSVVPGFRFHPTDAELVMYYLKRKVLGKKIIVDAVAEVNIYEYSPWDLRDKSALKNGDLEWFFFCPKSKKYNSGSRCNRATEIGFWKATGKDRTVTYKGRAVATIKTLVFHIGHSGKGDRTDWVMHEYRLEDEQLSNAGVVQDTYVLVKLFEKAGSGPKNGTQYGAPFNEDEWEDDDISCSALATVGPFEATTTDAGYKHKGPATVDMYEPGLSTVTCSAHANGIGNEEVPVDEVDMMSIEDIAFFLGVSEGFTGDNDNEVVQVGNVEENGTVAPNAEDHIYNELANLINLDELNGVNGGASASGFTPAAYMFAKPLDDLDFNMDTFFVD